MVSLPTPKWVLIRLAISSRLASTGTIVRPVATLSSSSGYRLNGSLVATTSVPFCDESGKSASRWMNREGKSCNRLRSISASTRSMNSRPTSSPRARKADSSLRNPNCTAASSSRVPSVCAAARVPIVARSATPCGGAFRQRPSNSLFGYANDRHQSEGFSARRRPRRTDQRESMPLPLIRAGQSPDSRHRGRAPTWPRP